MPKLYAVPDAANPVNPAEAVRKRVRETKHKAWPQCGTCSGREYIETRIGTKKTKLCVGCLALGRRREMS